MACANSDAILMAKLRGRQAHIRLCNVQMQTQQLQVKFTVNEDDHCRFKINK